MAPAPAASGWLRGQVKAVPSGDSLLIMAVTNNGIPPEKTITLSSLVAPKLARWDSADDPFAWDSREYLRKLCIGQTVTFKVDYIVPSTGREFGSVFIGEKNVAVDVVSQGWAKVRDLGQHKDEASPYLQELLHHQEQAKQQGLGRWNKARGASANSIRNLPPSAISDPIDALGLSESDIGVSMQGIVEHVRDGSTVRLCLLPDFQFVQVLVAGIQSPSMGRRGTVVATTEPETTKSEANGAKSSKKQSSLKTAQKLTPSTALSSEVPPSPFGKEAKHFTEIRVLNREVRIVFEGVDKFNKLVCSLYYPDGDSTKNLALELVENGLAKYLDWSANMMEDDAKRDLKNAELKAKKARVNMWTNYVPPASGSKPVHDQNFKGKVVEIVSGDCIIVADETAPFGSPLSERRVNLSSIRSPKMSNSRKVEKPSPYAREALEFLRTRLIGRQVQVSLEYTRKLNTSDDPNAESRVMDFGSVFLVSSSTVEGDDTKSSAPSQGKEENVAELLVSRGLATVVAHRDFEVRSNHYDDLLAAESRAISGKKGIHSANDPPSVHVTDLLTASARQAHKFLPFLQRSRRLPAIVEYIFSGHRFKLYIPNETCSIAFSLSGVRCPGRGKPYSDEAIGLVRRKILQRDVEIEIETCDRNGTFLGSLWESGTNIGVTLLESGLAKLQTSVAPEKITDFRSLSQAEQSAEQQKLKIWENILGDHENGNISNGHGNISNGHSKSKRKEVLQVFVTEVLGGGKFYIQEVEDPLLTLVQQRLADINLEEAPAVGSFNPKKGDVVLAKFSYDDSWNRALVVNTPQETATPKNDRFEVFYIDYGTQEVVTYDRLRAVDVSLSSSPGLAQLCSLAHLKVPELKQEYGREAAKFLSEITLDTNKQFRATVEGQTTLGGKVTGQGTGPILFLTLEDEEDKDGVSINKTMLLEGFAKVQRRKRRDSKETQETLDKLEEYQYEAKDRHIKIWEYGDIGSDDDEKVAPAPKKAGGRK